MEGEHIEILVNGVKTRFKIICEYECTLFVLYNELDSHVFIWTGTINDYFDKYIKVIPNSLDILQKYLSLNGESNTINYEDLLNNSISEEYILHYEKTEYHFKKVLKISHN